MKSRRWASLERAEASRWHSREKVQNTPQSSFLENVLATAQTAMITRFMHGMVFVSWLAGGYWDLEVRLEGRGAALRPFGLWRIFGVVGWPCGRLRCME
jgi:hypothetical protein